MAPLTFSQLIEANLGELLETRQSVDPKAPLRFYLEVLISYLKGDIKKLEQLVNERKGSFEPETAAATLRLQIRARSVDQGFLDRVIDLVKTTEDIAWQGELHFVIGLAYEVSNEDREAQTHFKTASEILELAGCRKKSIKAFSNYIAAETRIFPEKKLIVEYDYVYRKAKRLRELGVAGMALNNISREYQRAGAFNLALKYVNRALACLKHDFGSLHYYLAVVHRAHVLFDLKRDREAVLDLEQASVSDFPEIKEAVRAMRKIYLPTGAEENAQIAERNLTFTWRERLFESTSKETAIQLGGMEEKLVRLLALGSFDKFDIIEHLYGKEVNFLAAENRLKSLLGRVRRKHPGLIAFSDGKYRIADISFLPTEYLKAG